MENELISLSPSSFKSLKLYFTKFTALVLQLKQHGIEKKEERLGLTIISKIGPHYSMFFFTLYPTKLTSRTWNIPNLVEFMESLTQEKDKLVMMGTIKPSKDQDLVAVDSKVYSKIKKKSKNTPEQKRDKNKS